MELSTFCSLLAYSFQFNVFVFSTRATATPRPLNLRANEQEAALIKRKVDSCILMKPCNNLDFIMK